MPPYAGCYRVPGDLKILKPSHAQVLHLKSAGDEAGNLKIFNQGLRRSWHPPAARRRGSHTNRRKELQALVTVAISHGLLGRPVPSALLPSWPSPAMDATTSRDALSISPKIVKFGV
jgi:hypothetical protein